MSTWQNQLADARSGLRKVVREAALRLVAERGMPNVSMSAVARAAGVSRQTLYNHYPDLEAIMLDAARSEIRPAAAMIGETVTATPDAGAALELFIRGTLIVRNDHEVTIPGAGMSPKAETEVLQMLEPIHLHLRSILQRGVADGTFRADLDPEATSEVMFHMIDSGRRLIHLDRDPEQVVEAVTTLLRHAVADGGHAGPRA